MWYVKAFVLPIGATATVLVLLGCTLPATSPVGQYIATIMRVDVMSGEHYTLPQGRQTLYRIQLAVRTDPQTGRTETVSIYLFDTYTEPLFGGVNDIVAFSCAGGLPFNGKIWPEQLREYKVLKRGASPRELSR